MISPTSAAEVKRIFAWNAKQDDRDRKNNLLLLVNNSRTANSIRNNSNK